MEIRCVNGNKFICRGLDDPGKLKSIKDPSGAWYEEGNQMNEQDFITVSTTIRSKRARFLQEIITFNPETHGENYQKFWLWQKFFKGKKQKTFRSSIEIEHPVSRDIIEMTYTSIHSTYLDNPIHLPPEFIAQLIDLKRTNPHYYKVFCLGLWGNKEIGNLFYKMFTLDRVKKCDYIDTLPIYVSFDENVNPYMTMTVLQCRVRQLEKGRKVDIWQIDEFCLEHPRNTLKNVCADFSAKYKDHKEGLFVCGDRTSNKQDVKLEKGQNFFTLAMDYLKDFRPQLRIPSKNPNVKSRGEFINEIFDGKHPDINIWIDENCTESIEDYNSVQEDSDGTKLKRKVRDKDTKISYEEHGHTSDANDYAIIEILKTEYLSYISGSKTHEYKTMRRKSSRTSNSY